MDCHVVLGKPYIWFTREQTRYIWSAPCRPDISGLLLSDAVGIAQCPLPSYRPDVISSDRRVYCTTFAQAFKRNGRGQSDLRYQEVQHLPETPPGWDSVRRPGMGKRRKSRPAARLLQNRGPQEARNHLCARVLLPHGRRQGQHSGGILLNAWPPICEVSENRSSIIVLYILLAGGGEILNLPVVFRFPLLNSLLYGFESFDFFKEFISVSWAKIEQNRSSRSDASGSDAPWKVRADSLIFRGCMYLNTNDTIVSGMRSRSRSRSRQSRHILVGAGAGDGAAETFCSEPEPEPSKTGRLRLKKTDKLWKKYFLWILTEK